MNISFCVTAVRSREYEASLLTEVLDRKTGLEKERMDNAARQKTDELLDFSPSIVTINTSDYRANE